MKKVLFFSLGLVGGAERQTVLISKMLNPQKYNIKYVLVRRSISNDLNSLENFIPTQSNIINLIWSSQVKLFYDFYNTIRTEKPDVVFCSAMHLNIRLLLLSILFPKCRFVIRNENYLYTISKRNKILIKYLYKLADKIVTQTDEMKAEILNLGISSDKVYMLQNVIDTERINQNLLENNPYTSTVKKFVASGRFSHQKGFDILIEAFKLVIDIIPDAELYILGKNNGNCEHEYNKVIQIINKYGLQNNVFCLGFQNNPYKYVKNADVFVLSSRYEGLPNVLIEALYMGIPVAATTCIPIIERIVSVGKNGYLSPPEDYIALSKAMLNSLKLGHVESNYISGSTNDFIALFE